MSVEYLVQLFLSGKIFPPLLIFFGIYALILSYSKKHFENVSANNGTEYAVKMRKTQRITSVGMILCSIILFALNALKE